MSKKARGKRRRRGSTTASAAMIHSIWAAYCKLLVYLEKPFHRRSWDWLYPSDSKYKLKSLTSLFTKTYTFVVKVPWIIAIGVIAIIVVEGLTQQTTVIEPISVPKILAKNGYTSDVAARRLRDAIQTYLEEASSLMQAPGIAMQGELPNIIVPSVGISLDAVVASLRTLVHSTRTRTISGELTLKGKELSLQLRLDGRKIDSADKPADIDNPDSLFKHAAPKIMEKIKPYLVAVWEYKHGNKAVAAEMANEIIVSSTDRYGLELAHNFIGNVYFDHRDDDAAAAEYRKALDLDWSFAFAHYNQGLVHEDKSQRAKAKRDYARAGDELAKAIEEYREAIRFNPKFAFAYNNLGLLLTNPDDKERAFRKAIENDPKNARAYWNLGKVLTDANEKIAAYYLSLKFDSKNANVYSDLGSILEKQGRRQEAVDAYQMALNITPSNKIASDGLARLRVPAVPPAHSQ